MAPATKWHDVFRCVILRIIVNVMTLRVGIAAFHTWPNIWEKSQRNFMAARSILATFFTDAFLADYGHSSLLNTKRRAYERAKDSPKNMAVTAIDADAV
jgi:hypothetical protein